MREFRLFDTERLELRATAASDAEDLFAMFTDQNGWWYAPESRHLTLSTTRGFLERSAARWPTDGLSYWTVRRLCDNVAIGVGGIQRHRTGSWNLSYRLDTAVQGNGYAQDLSRAAIDAANRVDAAVPVIAWVAEINGPSRRVAERIGLVNYGVHLDLNDGERRLAYADREPDARFISLNQDQPHPFSP